MRGGGSEDVDVLGVKGRWFKAQRELMVLVCRVGRQCADALMGFGLAGRCVRGRDSRSYAKRKVGAKLLID